MIFQTDNYQDEYAKFAKQYSVGQQSNFINVEMLNEELNKSISGG